MDYRNLFKERLKLLRREMGFTQAELAAKLNVEKSTISKYEKGSTSPSYEMLWKLADFFHVSVDYLIGKSNSFNGDPNLDQQIGELKELFDAMSEEQKEKALKMLKIFLD